MTSPYFIQTTRLAEERNEEKENALARMAEAYGGVASDVLKLRREVKDRQVETDELREALSENNKALTRARGELDKLRRAAAVPVKLTAKGKR